jgi:hypothetical protein
MAIYFSPSCYGFFDTDVGYNTLPDDIIEITREQHEQLLHGVNILRKQIVVEEGTVKLINSVIVPTWDSIKAKRARLLAGSDYTQMPDWPGDKQAWATYRQQLRDIPQSFTAPEDVVWPTPPGV